MNPSTALLGGNPGKICMCASGNIHEELLAANHGTF
jgi:hypothetical protein